MRSWWRRWPEGFKSPSSPDVAHFAAESHVDRSILDGGAFVRTNVLGTQILLEAAREAWQAAARPPASLRYESFASSGHYASLPFTAVLPRHGCEIEVPANQSLLAALEAAGIETLSGCRRGECGGCALDILACDAPVDHRDMFLSEREKAGNRRICACVSRPAGGRIEIDTSYRGPASRI